MELMCIMSYSDYRLISSCSWEALADSIELMFVREYMAMGLLYWACTTAFTLSFCKPPPGGPEDGVLLPPPPPFNAVTSTAITTNNQM